MNIAIAIGKEIIKNTGGVEEALREYRGLSAVTNILLAHLHTIDPGEAERLAEVCDP